MGAREDKKLNRAGSCLLRNLLFAYSNRLEAAEQSVRGGVGLTRNIQPAFWDAVRDGMPSGSDWSKQWSTITLPGNGV
jgi:hypothetical protein